jgi:hypothetical protein
MLDIHARKDACFYFSLKTDFNGIPKSFQGLWFYGTMCAPASMAATKASGSTDDTHT